MKLTWQFSKDLIMVIASIVAALSIFTGFFQYRLTTRDEYAAGLRQVLSQTNNDFRELDRMLNIDLTHELAECVVYSEFLAPTIEQLYASLFETTEASNEIEKKELIKELIPPITVAASSHTLRKYNVTVSRLRASLAVYAYDFPALERILSQSLLMLENMRTSIVRLVRDEELWALLVMHLTNQDIDSEDEFKQGLVVGLVVGLVSTCLLRIQRTQKTINDLREIVDLLSLTYLPASADVLVEQSRYERSKTYLPPKETRTITADLREAEKGLSGLMDQSTALRYRELVARIEERYRKDEDSDE